ncbi:hypothetical protein FHETE_6665 [Fusarium heterosporum]|uniref:Uncharacterized protein n=1 Tax=Fusarium heterosporum TaxID=42747 RepID=A0A8H5T459_FUSHE|nr:hypothetical protein FHETE_6665 [Fusarium heterosporum]
MDFIKNAVSGGSKSENTAQGGSSNSNNMDYGDKAAEFLNKKAGTNISRDNQEKATDFARSQYEKQTGSKVDAKYSN